MKKLILILFLISFSLPSLTTAQEQLDNYKKFDYISVDQSQIGAFLKFANTNLKDAFQKLADSNHIKRWELYRIQYPGGKKSGYSFLSIVTGTDLDTLQSAFSSMELPGFLPEAINIKGAKILEICHLVKSELWNVENSISNNESDGMPSKYVTLDYMNVSAGKSPDYLMLEDEIAKPIHSERINQGNMASWQVYSLILPNGTGYGYNYSTFNAFDKLSDVEFGFTSEIINQTMGEKANITELFNTIYETRDRVKVELWKLVNSIR